MSNLERLHILRATKELTGWNGWFLPSMSGPVHSQERPKSGPADPGTLTWHLRQISSVPDMSRIEQYLIWIGLVLAGLVLLVALLGAAWLSAY